MAELQQLNLTQLKELIENHSDELAVGNYITQNLAVVRNIDIDIVRLQFSGTPTILPEMRLMLIWKGWARVTLNMIEHDI